MAEVKRYKTPVFRISFPALFEAESYDGGAAKYSCAAVWTPAEFTEREKGQWKEIMGAINNACKERFKKDLKQLRAANADGANFKLVPRDGKSKADLEGYGEGTVFANLSTKMRPGVINRKREKIGPEEGNAEEMYPGCYCRATITVYTYDNKGKGVSLGLMNIQKVRDGERLDSRTDANEDFDDDFLDESEETDTDDFLDDDFDS